MKRKFINYFIFVVLLLGLFTPSVFAIDFNNICGEEGVQKAAIIIGNVILVMKWLVPIVIIVLGVVDFVKATVSDDEKAVAKASTSLVRRFLAGLLVFFIPTILLALINLLNISDDIEKENHSNFGACTTCILDVKKCD